MKHLTLTLLLFIPTYFVANCQKFTRTELPTELYTPWEICYGTDSFLWITEAKGKVSRVDPNSGIKTTVYTAPDYFSGGLSEKLNACFQPNIGTGTLGLALHPDFPDSAYIYFVYSYNNGTDQQAETKFKIVRLRWDISNQKVVEASDLVLELPTGYDHLGGRLMALKQDNRYYLYFCVGDNGISEQNNPSCYADQSTNPNNFAQNPEYKNGKIHRFNIDGSIPFDNPIPENSFYTRGHRNPQGLMYNQALDIIYDVEHGDRSDDEINILHKGMNYGWKNVRGYHDGNFAGEMDYIKNYKPNPEIANDSLVSAFYSWCSGTPSTDPNNANWCTVAPSDGIFYNSDGIKEWTNSLLVVTLKNGSNTDAQMYQFKLNPDGKSLAPSTTATPNPKKYFTSDEDKNGRLRDITCSPDGKKIYLINNGGTNRDKITVYSLEEDSSVRIKSVAKKQPDIKLYPNPVKDILKIETDVPVQQAEITNMYGKVIMVLDKNSKLINVSSLSPGLYLLIINQETEQETSYMFLKE